MSKFGAFYAALAVALFWAGISLTQDQDAPSIQLIMNTERGDIELERYPARAPKTLANFMAYADFVLSKKRCYAGLTAHS